MTPTDLLQKHVANVKKPIDQQDLSIYAPDVLVEFPYAPEGHTASLTGPEAFSKFLAAIGEFSTDHFFDQMESFESGNTIIAKFRSNFTVKETGNRVQTPMVYIIHTQNNQITKLIEYYDPLRVLKGFGKL